MEKYIAHNLMFNCIYSTIFVIFASIGGHMVPYWVTILAAVIPSLITGIVTVYVNRKSQVNRNTEALKKLTEVLENREKGLKETWKDFTEKQLGIAPDDKTLTGQHKDMTDLLEREIKTAERRYKEEEKRIRDFTYEQHDMVKTMKDFRLFLDSWERMASEFHEMRFRITELEHQNDQLQQEKEMLERENRLLLEEAESSEDEEQNHDFDIR